MIKFFSTIGGFLFGSILLAFLTILAFNPSFFAEELIKREASKLANPPNNQLDKFLDESIISSFLNSPQTLTSLGFDQLNFLTNHNEKLDDYSLAYGDLEYERLTAYSKTLNNFDEDALDKNARINLKIARFSAENAMRSHESFRFHSGPFLQFYGSHLRLVDFMIDNHKVVDESTAEEYIKRVIEIERVTNELLEFEIERGKNGIYSPLFVYEKVLEQLKTLTNTTIDTHPLLLDFNKKLDDADLSIEAKTNLNSQLKLTLEEVFIPSYIRIIKQIEFNTFNARTHEGVWSLPNGDDYYQHRLRIFTTTNLSADQIHEIGLELVQSIQDEIIKILSDEGYDTTRPLSILFEELNTDPRFLFEDSDEGRQMILDEYVRIQENTYKILPNYFNELPKSEVVVRRVPEFAEKSAAGGYYQSPALDGSRPGVWFANLYDINATQSFKMPALSFHESVPGHHLQIALNQENENQTLWKKFGYSTSAFTEGWALYAEQLAIEAGQISDPFEMIGSLQSELFRAARLVIDTGLHSKKWKREEAIKYMMENVGEVRSEAESEIERYIVWPGQACSYMIGKIKIIELRERAKLEMGARFNIKDFHSTVLMNGVLPLEVLEELVEVYINS